MCSLGHVCFVVIVCVLFLVCCCVCCVVLFVVVFVYVAFCYRLFLFGFARVFFCLGHVCFVLCFFLILYSPG